MRYALVFFIMMVLMLNHTVTMLAGAAEFCPAGHTEFQVSDETGNFVLFPLVKWEGSGGLYADYPKAGHRVYPIWANRLSPDFKAYGITGYFWWGGHGCYNTQQMWNAIKQMFVDLFS